LREGFFASTLLAEDNSQIVTRINMSRPVSNGLRQECHSVVEFALGMTGDSQGVKHVGVGSIDGQDLTI
jgi:hypothetical protein